jgi:hypothetical protein
VSPQALEGIAAHPGEEVLLARNAPDFIATLIRHLGAPDAALGARARDMVLARYSWPAHLAVVDVLLEAGSAPSIQSREAVR